MPESYDATASVTFGPFTKSGFHHVELMLRPDRHCAWKDALLTLHCENFLDGKGMGRVSWNRAKEQVEPLSSHFQARRSALEPGWHPTPCLGDAG